MRKETFIKALIVATFAVGASAAYADFKMPKTKVSMEKCLKAALAKHAGTVDTMEMEISEGKAQYEFDIKAADGKEYEVECSALTGKVIEEEVEVANADDAAFKAKAKAKVTQADAEKAALAAFPGKVVESEFSIEADGNPSFEFDIVGADGKETEVEVDAVTGKVLEHETEVYQIGKE